MAIVRYLSNTNPILTRGLATIIESSVITRADEDDAPLFLAFNINDYDCCYEELAVADLEDEVSWKNDKTSLLFNLSLPTDSVEIKMFKDGQEIAILNNNTYGTFYPVSYFQALENPQLKTGMVIEWRKVLELEGPGCYYFTADREIINRNSVLETHKYELKPYNEFITDRTIRLNVFSTGYIEGGIDYLGFEWEHMIRLRGKFHKPTPTFETDNYQDTNRNIQQIQDQITTQYDLELEPIPRAIGKPLIYDRILGNRIIITDYNLFNYDRIIEREVYPVEISEAKFNNRTGNAIFNLKFTDKKQNIIKRNFI